MAKIIDNVYQETDYSKFKILNGNRDVVERRKNKILKSIKSTRYVLNPIIVNKKMEIIDGQGRFCALKELGLPIIYVIDANAGIQECIAMNIGQENWKTIDWVQMYAKQGDESYIRLLILAQKFKALSLETVFGIATNKIILGGFVNQAVKNGEISISEKDFDEADSVLEDMMTINETLEHIPGNGRGKKTAVAWILRNTQVNKKRLFDILNNNYPIIYPVVESKIELFLSQLSDLYNKKLAVKNVIYFDTEYKKWCREQ